MTHDRMFGPAWDVVELTSEQFWSLSEKPYMLTEVQLRYLCQYALLAPTSHNTIPERFRIDSDNQRVEIFLDRFFVLSESDPKGRQAMISIGAVMQHLRATAAYFGMSAEIDCEELTKNLAHVAPNDSLRYARIATCSFHYIPTQSRQLHTLAQIKARKNVRALYDKATLLPETIGDSIQEIAKQYSSLDVHVITNKLLKQDVAKFQEQADRFVLENQNFTRELGEWLLPNKDCSVPYAMRGSEFGFDDDYSQAIHDGLIGKTKLFADQIAGFAKGGKAGLESASAIVVITSTTDDPYAWLLAGQLYDEICLMLVSHSFVTAMHASLAEVDWANALFRTTVIKTAQRPLVILRIGRPADPATQARPHAVRPSLDQVLVGCLPEA